MFASIFLTKFAPNLGPWLAGVRVPDSLHVGPSLWVGLGLGYLAVGMACCWRLARAGYPAATAVSGLACWPLLLSLLQRQHPPGDRDRCDRIDAAIAGLRGALDHADPVFIPPGVDLDHLRHAMHRVNARIAWADRMLVECGQHPPGIELQATLDALQQSRQHAADELDSVLSSLVQLRIQLGLADLAEGNAPVAQCLDEVQSRVDALRALSALSQAPQ